MARSVPQAPAAAGEISDLSRLIRRVCLLRELGRTGEAEALETGELAAARAVAGSPAPAEFDQLYAAERRRATEAALLAELIGPEVARHLSATGPSGRPAPNHTANRPAAAPAAGPPAGPPAIPDLLDAMLAQDRAAARRRPAPGMNPATA